MSQNIVLIGMMGCGKTTVGRLLAQRFGRPLVDTDALIEERRGRSIPEIFAGEGEERFRALELELCRELGGRQGLVIACGGGLPLRDEAIAALSEEKIYTSSVKIKTELFGRRVIESLMDQFMPAAVKYDTEEPQTFIQQRTMDIISGFYKSMYHAEAAGKSGRERLYLRILMVTDYISGMTDSYARRLYKELFG